MCDITKHKQRPTDIFGHSFAFRISMDIKDTLTGNTYRITDAHIVSRENLECLKVPIKANMKHSFDLAFDVFYETYQKMLNGKEVECTGQDLPKPEPSKPDYVKEGYNPKKRKDKDGR